jgi:hypothetical protein
MKLSNLFTVGGLAALIGISSFNQPFNTAHAALTAPASWTFKYTNEDFPGYKIRNSTDVISTPAYTRTADGAYYNYTNTSTITTGLEVTQTFNRSNTTWYDNSGTYIPNDTKVGSDGTVGYTTNKIYFKFENQTNKNYLLYLDLSSNSNYSRIYNLRVDNVTTYIHSPQTSSFLSFVISSYSTLEFIQNGSINSSQYIDSWYLQDLGVSAAYEAGVDDGIIQGEQSADSTVLLDAVETVVGVGINFILMIMTFSIFDISLLNIALVFVAVIGIIWILKALRG